LTQYSKLGGIASKTYNAVMVFIYHVLLSPQEMLCSISVMYNLICDSSF
jgi:hypothetical protein